MPPSEKLLINHDNQNQNGFTLNPFYLKTNSSGVHKKERTVILPFFFESHPSQTQSASCRASI